MATHSHETFTIEQYTTRKYNIKLSPQAQPTSKHLFGFLDDSMIEKATAFASQNHIQGDFRAALTDFLSHARSTFLRDDQTSACLWIRGTISHEEWRVPRPHCDGRYWDADLNAPDEMTFKIGTCFVGPGTLFYDLAGCDETRFRAAQGIVGQEYYRKLRDEGLKDLDVGMRKWAHEKLVGLGIATVQPGEGECVKWYVGDTDYGAIHSEPDQSCMPDGRVFLALLPGTEAQVRDHAKNWNMPFGEEETMDGVTN